MDQEYRERLESRLRELKEQHPRAQAAYDREFDKDYDTRHLREARDWLNGIETEIASIEEQLKPASG
ncbi:hypothetical protein AB1L88_05980 [Tautonia sp. JC769]|uniref:hypothetical protein n=1 Tax=Tautonia sp. JC769 TaxID=3232135 RepID=UPI00345A8E7C